MFPPTVHSDGDSGCQGLASGYEPRRPPVRRSTPSHTASPGVLESPGSYPLDEKLRPSTFSRQPQQTTQTQKSPLDFKETLSLSAKCHKQKQNRKSGPKPGCSGTIGGSGSAPIPLVPVPGRRDARTTADPWPMRTASGHRWPDLGGKPKTQDRSIWSPKPHRIGGLAWVGQTSTFLCHGLGVDALGLF